jgi:hypothetical protein
MCLSCGLGEGGSRPRRPPRSRVPSGIQESALVPEGRAITASAATASEAAGRLIIPAQLLRGNGGPVIAGARQRRGGLHQGGLVEEPCGWQRASPLPSHQSIWREQLWREPLLAEHWTSPLQRDSVE